MEYIIEKYTENREEETIQARAARIAGLNLISIHNGGITLVYNDFGLNKIQREYKKVINQIISEFEYDGIYSSYKYDSDYIESVKSYVKSIKPNSRKA